MRRTILRSVMGRLGVVCYALWAALALVTQDATPCPTHDGPGASAVAMAMMPASMAMGGQMDMPSSRGAMHHAAHGSSHGAHHGCTCVGCGCCVAALDLCAPSRALVPAPPVVARGTTTPLTPSRTGLPRVGRRLPFANAPPVLMSSAA